MATKNVENWLSKYTSLREHVESHGHLTDRHTQLNHWWKYQKKKRKEGKLTEEQCRLLDEMLSFQTHEHTGGRKIHSTSSGTNLPTPSPELLLDF